jgi:penicillin-binding protein 2
MQQLVFYGALATGILWRPQVVQRIEDADGRVIQEFAPQERGRPHVQKSTRETVLKGLLAAVNEPFGTAYSQRLKDMNIVMAGKTGTAQVVKLGAHRLKASQVGYFERDHAWFAAFAPAEDPEIVVVVLNEHSGFGASNAAPTAAAVVKKYFELKAQDAAERAGPVPPEPAPATPPRPPSAPATPPIPEKPKLGVDAAIAPEDARG